MKFLKYLLIVIVLLALFFFGKGLLTPSISYGSEITVDKPIEEAWAVMSDESKISDWLTSIKKIELVEGTKNTVGAVSNIYVIENGEEMMMKETITAFEPNRHIAMTFTMDFMDMDYAMFMEEKDGKTNIRTESTTSGNGLFAKSVVSFMTGAMQTQEDQNLGNLKQVIEENSTNYTNEYE